MRLSLTGRFHFEKKWNILFFRKSTVALICVYFIQGGALSSNTVLIAFEGFNFFNQYIFFYQFVWHLRASLHFWSIITFVTSTHIHLFQLRLLPWTMFHSLQCTMVNPFVAGSLVLFTFIEIMEIICEKAFKRAFKSNGC